LIFSFISLDYNFRFLNFSHLFIDFVQLYFIYVLNFQSQMTCFSFKM